MPLTFPHLPTIISCRWQAVTDPIFWLVLSLFFLTISLTAMLIVAIPALRELARAARSAEKLFDTLRREFPPTLEAIRLTGLEISELTDDVSEGVQSAGQVVKQLDQGLTGVRKQARKVRLNTRTVMTGVKAAWRSLTQPAGGGNHRRSVERLSAGRPNLEWHDSPLDPAAMEAGSPTDNRRSDGPDRVTRHRSETQPSSFTGASSPLHREPPLPNPNEPLADRAVPPSQQPPHQRLYEPEAATDDPPFVS